MAKELDKIGHGPFDAVIVEGFAANKSAEEVSIMPPINGLLTPAQCLARVTQLVKSKDVLDVRDRLALALDDAYWLRSKLKKQMTDAEFIDAQQATVFLKTLDAITARIERAQLGLTEQLLRFNERRAHEMVEALNYIMAQVLESLDQRGIEKAELDEIVLEAIPNSIPEVEK